MKNTLFKKEYIIIGVIAMIFVLVGIVLWGSREKAKPEFFYVDYVKSFDLITTVTYHADVFKGKIQGKEVIYAYEAPITLAFDLKKIDVKGDTIILPKCQITANHEQVGEYIVGGDRGSSGKEAEQRIRELRNRIDQEIEDSIYAKGYVNRAYLTAKNMLENFLEDCECPNVIVCPNSYDVKKFEIYKDRKSVKEELAQYGK